jgi:hypothetical protein
MWAFAVAAILALGFATAPLARASLVLQFDSTNYVAGTWTDTSGNANHATQGTVGSQPTLTGSTPLGKPALVFDGTDDLLGLTTALSGAAFTTSPNFTMLTVVNNKQPDSSFHISPFISGSGADNATFENHTGAGVGGPGRLYLSNPGINGAYSDFVNTNGWDIYAVTYAGGGIGNLAFYTNGVLVATGAGSLTTFANPITQIGGHSGRGFFRGQMAALYVYDTALSSTDVRQLSIETSYSYLTIPEPSTVMLFAVGGLVLWRRRSRNW